MFIERKFYLRKYAEAELWGERRNLELREHHFMIMGLYEYIIFFSGVLYIFIASVQLFERKKMTGHYIVIRLLVTVGIWQLYHGCMAIGLLNKYPHLTLTHVPFLYLTAPLLYSFFKILAGDSIRLTKKSVFHMFPFILLTVILLPFYFQTADEKLALINNPYDKSLKYPFYPFIILIFIVTISLYASTFIIRSFPLLIKKELAIWKMTVVTIINLAIDYFLIFLYLIGLIMVQLFNFPDVFYISIIKIISLFLVAQIFFVLVIMARYPFYFKQISDEGRRIRYATSRIDRLNVDDVLEKLNKLMDVDKIYCDEDISLNGLARKLEISHYQLSQILNERLSKNFNTYINEFRIREAEKMLIADPLRSVTSISYAVGFNTISSFYNSFSKMHNMSPVAFRKNMKFNN